jgi:hypothetical protein
MMPLIEAQKDDQNKVPLHLVDPLFIYETAKGLGYGEKKYAPWDWAKGSFEWHRLYRAMQGHMMDWYSGEDIDPESGVSHLALAACNLMFLMRYQHMEWGKDTRPHMLRSMRPQNEQP